MRVAALCSILVLVGACGGSKKPAEPPETPSPDTSASSAAAETPAPADSASEAPDGGPSSAPAESAATPAPSASSGPTATGAIDGKPFAPKMARIVHAAQKDGRVLVLLDERSNCGGEAKPGDGILSLTVTLEDGYKVDLGSLKRGGKKGGGEISFVRVGANGKKDLSTTFKPTGRATVVKAPMEQNAVGKLNIDLQSGDYMLSGDLDFQACVAPKAAPKGAPKKKK